MATGAMRHSWRTARHVFARPQDDVRLTPTERLEADEFTVGGEFQRVVQMRIIA
jgi:hypothetical protein